MEATETTRIRFDQVEVGDTLVMQGPRSEVRQVVTSIRTRLSTVYYATDADADSPGEWQVPADWPIRVIRR